MCGFIKLHRQITEWEWYDDINTTRLFIHLLLKASVTNRSYKGISIKKGQLITSRKLLAEQTKLSQQKVRTCLKRLESTNEIHIKTTTEYTIITVKKWANFQGFTGDNQPTANQQKTINQPTINQPLTNDQPAINQQITTVKECEERKNVLVKDNLTVIKKNKVNSSKTKGTRFKAERDSKQNAIIPDKFYEYAAKQGISGQQLHNQFQSFADYWESVAGNRGVKLDWLATWRNWLRNSFSSKQNNVQTNTSEALKDITDLVNASPLANERPPSAYNLGK